MNTLFLLPLLLFPPQGPTVRTVEAAPPAFAPAEDLDSLLAEYDAAARAHAKELREAEDRDVRRELRRNPPAASFWPRFDAFARDGEGRALLWMVSNLQDSGLGPREKNAERLRLYAELFEKHAQADWIGGALAQLPKDRRDLAERITAYFRVVVEKNPSLELQAQALHLLHDELARSKEESDRKEAAGILDTLAEKYSDTEYVKGVDELYRRLYLSPGKLAPDFDGKTIDGHAFKLSDYRGKVVLIDFYGFW